MTTNIRFIGSLALVLAFGAAAACGGDGPPTQPQTGTVAGKVSNGAAGLAGVSVSIAGGGSATTDAGGNFSISGVATGAHSVAIVMPAGFITTNAGEGASKGVTVSGGQTATVNFALTRGVLVSATSNVFTPQVVTVPPGATVRWVGVTGTHTVTPTNPGQPGAWASANLPAGAVFEHTFGTTGTFDYLCIPHQAMGMTGTVTVGG
ncbi:plastocyanin/azurin family copper-binding protein [Longimicrobium sp.]|jgi:plastocyanin|uniref:plastocyanin/azurin family copper-binding protein n=1 Tax=Longimicrobium sp. TaxID=2029185 RepID=UPI002ED77EA1